jgi:hypothetical protein
VFLWTPPLACAPCTTHACAPCTTLCVPYNGRVPYTRLGILSPPWVRASSRTRKTPSGAWRGCPSFQAVEQICQSPWGGTSQGRRCCVAAREGAWVSQTAPPCGGRSSSPTRGKNPLLRPGVEGGVVPRGVPSSARQPLGAVEGRAVPHAGKTHPVRGGKTQYRKSFETLRLGGRGPRGHRDAPQASLKNKNNSIGGRGAVVGESGSGGAPRYRRRRRRRAPGGAGRC